MHILDYISLILFPFRYVVREIVLRF